MQDNSGQHRSKLKLKSTLALTLTLACLAALAGGPDHMAMPFTQAPQHTHKFEAFISLGANATSLTNNANVVMDQFGTTNAYYTNKQTHWNVVSGAGLQWVHSLHHHLNISVGPAFYYTDLGNIAGLEYPDISGGGVIDTLNYKFAAQSFALMLESHLICTRYAFHPFLIAGIGNSWNNLSHYSEVPTDPNSGVTAANSVFTNNTQTEFAYEVGAGVSHHLFTDKKHNMDYNVALEYRYFNFGAGKLGQSAVQQSSDYLRVPTLDASAIMATLSAAFA